MTIEIVDFPIKNGGSFHSYVSLPEGMCNFFGRERIAKMTGLLGFRHTLRRLIDFFSKVGAWAAWKSDHQQWGAGCLRDLEALPSQCLYRIFRQKKGRRR